MDSISCVPGIEEQKKKKDDQLSGTQQAQQRLIKQHNTAKPNNHKDEVHTNKEPGDAGLKEIKDMLKCLLEQNNEKQLQIERQHETIRNLEAQLSQVVGAVNAQQANIGDRSQEEHEFEMLIKKVRVEYHQPSQLQFEDVNVEEVRLESAKDFDDTNFVDSSIIDIEDVEHGKQRYWKYATTNQMVGTKCEGEVEKTVVADDEPFTEAESYFADAKFYLKNRIVKELKADDGMKRKNKDPSTKIEEVTTGEAKAASKEVQPNTNKSYRGNVTSCGKKVSLTLEYIPKRKKDESESSNRQANMLKELTLPVKRIEAVFAKAGYNPNEPSKLGKLTSEAATRQPREGLGYKQSSPLRISI
ncbi:uncharacterized protein [Nicotiana sylvestris]|uniref:uncharacterized protein n=1 Tax=Nicotiana sylvestris TaxID=4096 RepID=UPI00388CEA6F